MKSRRILLFIALAVLLLSAICLFFPKQGANLGFTTLRFPSLQKILNPQKQLDLDAYLAEQDSIERARQLELASRQDSIRHIRRSLDSSDTRFWFPQGNDHYFDALFADMEKAQSRGIVLRVLHYGDSQIEMDRMSNRLRASFQDRFGGGGPGFIPFSTLIPSQSVSIYAEGSLTRLAPFGDSTVHRSSGNYGPMVQDFHLAGSAHSSITAASSRNAHGRLRQFSRIRLLFNNRPGPLSCQLSCRSTGFSDEQHCGEAGVHTFEWQLDTAVSAIRLNASGEADLYGIMVDDGPGVAVDNIPMRGCSGQQFTQISQALLTDAYAKMDIGLIILQFGGNSVPYIKTQEQIDYYCKNLGRQIDRLHECCPKAKILFIGPSDMSTKIDGQLQSYPFLPTIVSCLQRMANEHDAAYWSIYHAMGGYDSMVAWVERGLAGSDYLHFSQRGADIMGDRLCAAFDMVYQLYRLRADQ